jgi:inhibitor of KinA
LGRQNRGMMAQEKFGSGKGGPPNGVNIRPCGDCAVLVEFENQIAPRVNAQVRSLARTIESAQEKGVGEVLPAYRSLMIFYDPCDIAFSKLVEKVSLWLNESKTMELPPGRFFRLPTVYGGDYGPDLHRVSRYSGLSPDEVIRVFSETRFLVYFIGFICGLAYLGGLPGSLQVPRLETPRTLVPAGSVGLAGGQANALTTDQPSGFNYIGRTFINLYQPGEVPPAPFQPGDILQFRSVPEKEALESRGGMARDFL